MKDNSISGYECRDVSADVAANYIAGELGLHIDLNAVVRDDYAELLVTQMCIVKFGLGFVGPLSSSLTALVLDLLDAPALTAG